MLHPNKINCFMEEFGVDSSGFPTSRFIRSFDHQYGVVKQAHEYVKVHLAVGANTFIITAGAISSFHDAELSADKAYLSVENVGEVGAVGSTPFIARRSTGLAELASCLRKWSTTNSIAVRKTERSQAQH
jgi:hypothetical protein